MRRIVIHTSCYSTLLLFMVMGVVNVYGQNVVFTAAASANKIGTKDQIQVQYTIKDAHDLQSVSKPSEEDFVIVGGPYQSQSSNTSIIGNKVTTSQSISFTYVFQPRREGTFSIPPMSATDAEGHTYQSNTLKVEVVPGTVQRPRQQRQRRYDPFSDPDDDVMAIMRQMQQMQQQRIRQMQQMQQGQRPQQQRNEEATPVNDADIKKDIFIKVAVDKSKVHLGEQITISYKLYSRIPMQVGISKLPSLNGFWTQDFDIPKQAKPTEEVLNGKKYQVFLLKKSALFPQQTGTLELDPAEAKGMARILQQVRASDPFGNGTLMMNDPFFNNSFYNRMAYRDVKVHLKSTPVKVRVTALPEKGKPENYGGAVGNFSINSKIDKRELSTDDVATLTLKIEGSGNLKLIEPPKLDLPNGLNTYDPVVIDTITGRSTTISGSKIITYVLSPQTPGDYEIPATDFTFYNPKTDSYETQHTAPLKLHVTPGKRLAKGSDDDATSSYKDIHDIVKQAPTTLNFGDKPLFFKPSYWSLYLLPLVFVMGYGVWKKREDELSQNTVLLRKRRANKVALQRLTTAKKLLQQQNKQQFYEEVSKAIWLYMSDKLSIPLSALSRETATEALTSKNIPESTQKKLNDVILECETSLYATGGSRKMADTYNDAVSVISNLEDIFKA